MTAIVWFRQDLRLSDNPALRAAIASGQPILGLYVLDDETPGAWRIGAASRWWLHHSLEALSADIAKNGGKLILRRGPAGRVVLDVAEEADATAIYWNRTYEPFAVERDKALKQKFRQIGVTVETSNGALMHEPWEVRTKSGEPYKVFTPYWRACLQRPLRALAPGPGRITPSVREIGTDDLSSWRLLPSKPNWAKGFEPEWRPGEAGAHAALQTFINDALQHYAEGRDQLALAGTSRLSAHLHYGEISPVQVRTAIELASARDPALERGGDKFLAELGWREFSTSLLFHWPKLPETNWRAQFDSFAWRDDATALEAWRRGKTGYPIVDAAMRQLWITGFMHNRARMIAASFLIKHLLIDWREGEAWFWDTLVDADLANNAASWQWIAGSGADASPYFRIFNPITQGQRYDPDGDYVRRWVPELAKLDASVIHEPWTAPPETLADAGVKLGKTYPRPLVDHAAARGRALEAYAALPRT